MIFLNIASRLGDFEVFLFSRVGIREQVPHFCDHKNNNKNKLKENRT